MLPPSRTSDIVNAARPLLRHLLFELQAGFFDHRDQLGLVFVVGVQLLEKLQVVLAEPGVLNATQD